jgi:diguanylate cyclase (GGDEF)-like protein
MNSGDSLEDLHRLGTEQLVRSGDYLWREGDTGEYAVLILSGVFEVLNGDDEGDFILLRTLGPGSFAGEMSVLDGSPRSASLRARSDGMVLRFRDVDFRQLIRMKPLLLERLFWEQVQRVRTLTQQIGQKHRKSITDSLTRLYNYGFFRDRLEMEIDRARATGDTVGIILFDIDHFKRFNDHWGHESGNQVLIAVADIFREMAKRGDVVARYGGEEFVALLYGSTRQEAIAFAEALRERIEGAVVQSSSGEEMPFVTMSGGIALFPTDADDAQSLIEVADQNLYLAKEDGRNRVHWYAGEVRYRPSP